MKCIKKCPAKCISKFGRNVHQKTVDEDILRTMFLVDDFLKTNFDENAKKEEEYINEEEKISTN